MEWIINQLRVHPELAIFLTLFAGFWLGRLKIGKFSLGTVTSVLLVGVLVGQLNITVDGPLKAVFFLLFLFAVGYKVGPQFCRGLKKDGLPQVGFAALLKKVGEQCIHDLIDVGALRVTGQKDPVLCGQCPAAGQQSVLLCGKLCQIGRAHV